MRGCLLDKVMFFPNLSSLRQGCLFPQRSCRAKSLYQNPLGSFAEEVNVLENSSGIEDDKLRSVEDDGVSLSKEVEVFEKNMKDSDQLSLPDFKDLCPPGGTNSIVLYTTSLRSILKTFEDCQTILTLLRSFKLKFYERDVSMHLEFREELCNLLKCKTIPPKLFIKGKYIGGAEEVITLHEQGQLMKLVEGMPTDPSSNHVCVSCGNQRFIVCLVCSGSRKLLSENHTCIKCPQCNENGLARCIACSH